MVFLCVLLFIIINYLSTISLFSGSQNTAYQGSLSPSSKPSEAEPASDSTEPAGRPNKVSDTMANLSDTTSSSAPTLSSTTPVPVAVETTPASTKGIRAPKGDDLDQDLNEYVVDTKIGDASAFGLMPVNRSVDFFGVKSSGQHVAFVIDCSTSMENGNLNIAKRELLKSVARLSPSQFFSVYFFHDSIVSNSKFVNRNVTPKSARQLKSWLATIRGFGGTDPLPAMQAALSLETVDVIFLLSDGQFLVGTDNRITSKNNRKAVINTLSVGFDNRSMRQIARDNEGRYRFIKK